MFFKIASRNVFRNKRRTALSLFVVAFGVSILYLVIGFINESLESTKVSMADLYGSVQIADERVFDKTTRGYTHLIDPEMMTQVEALLNADERVTGYKQELGFFGLIGNEKGSKIITGSGFVPENSVKDFSEAITDGKALNIADGCPLNDRLENCQLIIGRRLAASLNVAPGDFINVATTSVTGNFSAASVTINGVFKFNDIEQEGQIGYVALTLAQRILRTDKIEKYVVNLTNLDDARGFAQDFQAQLDAAGLPLVVKTWQDLNPLYDQVQEFGNYFTAFTLVGVFILAFFGVLEVLTMSFLERTREVGTVRAVGTKRSQVFFTFVIEGFILGILGGVFGIVLGAVLGFVVNQMGLTWLPPGSIDAVPAVIQLSVSVAAVPFLVALISTFFGTMYPAMKSSRFNIVKALGYV